MGKRCPVGEIRNTHPEISIVLPTYNRAAMLNRAVKSIIAQDYINWELLIVDNSSTDDTDYVVSQFDDDRIKIFKISNEGSIGKSRNYGIRKASGNWIAFIDSDDWWLPNKLRVCMDTLEEGDIDLVYHDFSLYRDEKIVRRKMASKGQLKAPVAKELILNNNPIINSSVVVRRELFSQVGFISEDMNINPSVDYNTWLRIARLTNAFKHIPMVLGCYETHSGGVSQRDMSISDTFAIANFTDDLTPRELSKVNQRHHYISGRYKFLKKDYSSASDALRKSLSFESPRISIKALIMLMVIFYRSDFGFLNK